MGPILQWKSIEKKLLSKMKVEKGSMTKLL